MKIHLNLFDLIPIPLKRWFYRTFRKKRCVQMIMSDCYFKYGDIVTTPNRVFLMYLGKNWYLILKNDL